MCRVLGPGQKAHFETFGFLLLPQCFSAEEIDAFTRAAEEIWTEDPKPEENGERRLSAFVERRADLTRLAEDDRIWSAVEMLMGPDFIWVGSEGNISNRSEVKWHSDRKYYRCGEEGWIDYPQVKAMLYLTGVQRESGALRVIPGSHKMPLHKDLAQQEVAPESMPFGCTPQDIPSLALQSEPGDLILFHHCLWHSSFGGGRDRRYIALKFAARPFASDHLITLERYTPDVFRPHKSFAQSGSARIRSMVDPLAAYAEGRLERD